MVRKKKTATESKTAKCSSRRRMPVTSGSGNGKETTKSKKRTASGELKKSGTSSSTTGRGKQNEPVPASSILETSKSIITTPSRLNHPFLRSSVRRPARNQSPPPGPSQDKSKEKEEKEKQGKTDPPKTERKRWEAWSNQDKQLFFEAVSEHGKDFEMVQKYIEHRHKKLGYPPHQIKNKDQVRHFYYRTCHKLLSCVTPIPDQPRVNTEMLALINYGELRKKLKGGFNVKVKRKLDQLVTQGVTYVRFNGRNVKLKTPVCKALKKLKNLKEEEKPVKLPARVLLELQPRSNAAWAEVQGVAHNPRLRLVVPLQKDIGNLLNYLSEKWTPHRIRLLHSLKPTDKSNFSQVQLHVPKGTTITPYHKLQGCFIHANSKTPFTMVAKEEPSDEGTVASGSPPKSAKVDGDAKTGNQNENSDDEGMLHPDLDGNIQDVKVDLLSHHPSDPIITDGDGGNLSSVFGDNHSLGDLLSTITNGTDTHCGDTLTFSNLSLTLPGNHIPALSLAKPTGTILSHPVSKATDSATTSVPVASSKDTQTSAQVDGKTDSLSQDGNVKADETVEEEKVLSKDELLRNGLTAKTGTGMNITDVYLMMGQPSTLKFEYEFIKKTNAAKEEAGNQMMNKLVNLAKSSFTEVVKPKQYVSVGVVTSPISNKTPPSKSQAGSHNSPANSRSPRGGGSRNSSKGAAGNKAPGKGSAASTAGGQPDHGEKNQADPPQEEVHFAVPKSAAPIALRRSQEPSHAQEGQQMLNQFEQMKRPQANFLLPRMKKRQRGVKPLVVQRTILPRPLPNDKQADHMVSMAILDSSQANMGQFMPIKVNMSSLGNVVPSRTQPRPIKPNITGVSTTTIAGVGKTVTKTVIAPNSGGTKTVVRRIVPVNVTNSPLSGGNILEPSSQTSLSPDSPLMPSSPAPESQQVNQVSTSQLCNSPLPSSSPSQPLGCSTPARTSPHTISADSSILSTTVILEQGTVPPSPMDSSVLNTPVVVHKDGPSTTLGTSLLNSSLVNQPMTPMQPISVADSSLLNTPVVSERDTPSSTNMQPTTTLHISPPEISALLDISLSASENGDGLSSISLDSTTFRTFGQNISATSPNSTTADLLNSTLSRDIGNSSPTSSPFKINSLGPEAQWFNGESLDISMSSLLGHLESPEKKDRSIPASSGAATTTASSSSSLALPPGILSESSRDSIITRDVDSTLQVMLNENSMDYVAKFADLTAHLSATSDTQHKNNIIDKALAAEEMERATQDTKAGHQATEVAALVDV
ncbi:protein cramped-like [Diadema antillarum]|uniref:protein cramped-like n=1 Tax=Diadema antillarum TaxID=105358 RepID=UPI003A8B1C95